MERKKDLDTITDPHELAFEYACEAVGWRPVPDDDFDVKQWHMEVQELELRGDDFYGHALIVLENRNQTKEG